MPKAFNEADRDRIRSRLIAAGKAVLNRSGVRGLVVADVARDAGISKGSFYAFFPSREEFLMEVFETWEEEYRTPLLADLTAGPGTVAERWVRFFRGSLSMLDREPGLALLGTQDVRFLVERLPPERIATHQAEDQRVMGEAVAQLVFQGVLAPRDAEAFFGAGMVLFALFLQRDLFPPGAFGPAALLVADALALKFSQNLTEKGVPHG